MKSSDSSDYYKTFAQHFRESETRIGISIKPSPADDKPWNAHSEFSHSVLSEHCDLIRKMFDGASAKLDKNKYSHKFTWLMNTRYQLIQLYDMSKNPVLDGLCYLAVDSVTMFCKEAKKLIENLEITDCQLGEIQKFIRGWAILLEQASRVDGRFAQTPGFSPPLYEIPSKLLELYLAFIQLCVDAMSYEQKPSYRYSVLLVPKLCRKVKVSIILSDRMPPCDRILYVDIPLDILYDPFKVICELTHEISHFCGDVWRHREFRKNSYFIGLADIVARRLYIHAKENVKCIFRAFITGMSGCSNTLYLDNLHSYAYTKLDELIHNTDTLVKWQNIAFNNLNLENVYDHIDFETSFEIGTRNLQNMLSSIGLNSNDIDIEMLTELYRECYADISMNFLLGLTVEDYFRLPIDDLNAYHELLTAEKIRNIESLEELPDDYYSIVQRWALVSCAYFDMPLRNLNEFKYPRFAEDVFVCIKYITSSMEQYTMLTKYDHYLENISPYFLSSNALDSLRNYLSYCSKEMKNTGGKAQYDKVTKIRNTFNAIVTGTGFDNKLCNEAIALYESLILNSYF